MPTRRKPKPKPHPGSKPWRASLRDALKASATAVGTTAIGLANLITADNISAVVHYEGKIAAGLGAFMGLVHFIMLLCRDSTSKKE